MIEVNNLTIKDGNDILLDNISFNLKKGTMTVLLGPNGSGKTTLFRALSSYYRRYSGEILYDGKDLKSLSRDQRSRYHGFLPQALPELRCTVSELMDLASDPDNKDNADEILSYLGLDAFKDRIFRTLSGGEKELVFLAFIMLKNSEAFFLDEPEAALDSVYAKRVERAMMDLKKKGKTILFSMHDVSKAIDLADEIMILQDGALVFQGDKASFIEEKAYSYLSLNLEQYFDKCGNEKLLFI